jgi:hypothetical protein
MLNGNFTNLFTDGVLIDLSIRYWQGKAALRAEDLDLDPSAVPEIFSLGRKRLIPKDVVGRFRSYEEKAAYALEKASFPFAMNKVRFVPTGKVPEIIEMFETLKRQFEEEKSRFLKSYSTIREQMLQDNAEHRRALEGFYPTKVSLERRFGFEWVIFTIALPKNLKLTRTTAERLDREAKGKALAEQRYLNGIARQTDAFLEDVVTALREKTATLCEHVQRKLAKGELVTEATIRSVRDHIDHFKSMNFMGDAPVAAQLSRLRKALGDRSAKEVVDAKRATAAVSTALQAVIDASRQLSDITSITGGYKRKIALG